jgi:hypothetical protein
MAAPAWRCGRWRIRRERGDRYNQAVNSALASVVSVDDGGIELPVEVVQKGNRLEVAIKTTGASFAVTLDSSAGVLSGTYTERQFEFPISFRR